MNGSTEGIMDGNNRKILPSQSKSDSQLLCELEPPPAIEVILGEGHSPLLPISK